MWTVIIVLLVLWAILAVVGAVFKGLLWLTVVGVILFVGTLAVGFVRRQVNGRRRGSLND